MPVIPKAGIAGFALLEALVASVLLSAGLAATAGLLVQALRHEREAAYRSAATRRAASLADELKLLRRSDGMPLQAIVHAGDPPPCDADAHSCAVERTAVRVLADWQARVAVDLPAGSWWRVALLETAEPAYLIEIGWPSPGGPGRSSLRLAVEP